MLGILGHGLVSLDLFDLCGRVVYLAPRFLTTLQVTLSHISFFALESQALNAA